VIDGQTFDYLRVQIFAELIFAFLTFCELYKLLLDCEIKKFLNREN